MLSSSLTVSSMKRSASPFLAAEPRDGPRGKATSLSCSYPRKHREYSIHQASGYIVVSGRRAHCGICNQPIEFLPRQRAPVPNNEDGTPTRKWTEQPAVCHHSGQPGMDDCVWRLYHINCMSASHWELESSTDTESSV